MDYIKEHFPNPEEVFITGCSAGAYGAILHSTTVAQEFPEAKMTVLGDSGAGIITDEWFADNSKLKAEEALPSWFELPGGTVEGLTIVDVYSEIANYHPNARFAQYTTAFDSNQEFYYTAMSGDPAEWGGKMITALDEIVSLTENFTYYVTPGEVHCITPYSIMYTPPATGPTVVEWMSELLTAEETPVPTLCDGDECTNDVWCQGAKAPKPRDPLPQRQGGEVTSMKISVIRSSLQVAQHHPKTPIHWWKLCCFAGCHGYF